MPRLKPAEIAVILERIRAEFPTEVGALEAHIDSVDTEDALLSVVREMIESKEQSKAAEMETARILNSWKPTLDASAAALAKLAEEERRRNDLKKRELDRQERIDTQKHEVKKIRLQQILVPIATAIAGAIAAGAAFYFGG